MPPSHDPSHHASPLSWIEFQILLALASEDLHGYGIMAEVAERTDGALRIEAGNLYRALQRMTKKGLVVKADRRADPALEDRRRRYYKITRLGREAAAGEARRMRDLVEVAQERALLEPGTS